MNEKIKPLQYVRYDVQLNNGYLVCSIPNLELGYFDTLINTAGYLFIDIDYGTN